MAKPMVASLSPSDGRYGNGGGGGGVMELPSPPRSPDNGNGNGATPRYSSFGSEAAQGIASVPGSERRYQPFMG